MPDDLKVVKAQPTTPDRGKNTEVSQEMKIKSPAKLLQSLIIGGVLAGAVAFPSLAESGWAFSTKSPAPFSCNLAKVSVSLASGEDRRCAGCHESLPRRKPRTDGHPKPVPTR